MPSRSRPGYRPAGTLWEGLPRAGPPPPRLLLLPSLARRGLPWGWLL